MLTKHHEFQNRHKGPAPVGRRSPDSAQLTAAEEIQLATAAQQGNHEALGRLLMSNQGLVVTIARELLGRGLTLEDLIGEGNLGLIRAAQDFDPGYGARFGTYAGHWIRQAMREALIKTARPIRLPHHVVALVSAARRTRRQIEDETGSVPSFQELVGRMGLTEQRQAMLRRALLAIRFVGVEPEGPDQLDGVADGHAGVLDEIASEEDRRLVGRSLELLDERSRRVLIMRYGLSGQSPMSYQEMGRVLGCTREWARKSVVAAHESLARKLGHARNGGDGPCRSGPRRTGYKPRRRLIPRTKPAGFCPRVLARGDK